MGHAEGYFAAAGAAMWPPDRLAFAAARAAVQSRLPVDQFATSWAHGRELTLNQVIAVAAPPTHPATPDR
jgi:hypothetical protein